MQDYLTVIGAVASVFFLAWAFIVHPTESKDDHEAVGRQLMGVLGVIVFLTTVGWLALLILPYVGMAALIALGVVLGIILIALLFQGLRGFFPRLKVFLRFILRQTGKLLHGIWRSFKVLLRLLLRIGRNTIALVAKMLNAAMERTTKPHRAVHVEYDEDDTQFERMETA